MSAIGGPGVTTRLCARSARSVSLFWYALLLAGIIVAAPDASHAQLIKEDWETGIDALKWSVFGTPLPNLASGIGWLGGHAVDPNGDGNCSSGLLHKMPVLWSPGAKLSARFITNICYYGACVDSDNFPPHEIWAGVSGIQANINEATIVSSGSAQIIASKDGINLVAVYDSIGRRIAWDATLYRFSDNDVHPNLSIAYCDNALYVRNLAVWLSGGADYEGDSILVYTTDATSTAAILRRWGYDEGLKAVFENEGFHVRFADRETMPILSADTLSQFEQIWIISTAMDEILGAEEVSAIHAFYDEGGGLMIISDSWTYSGPANQISRRWGVAFSGQYNTCSCECGSRANYWQEIQIGLATGALISGVCANNDVDAELYVLIQTANLDGGPRISLYKTGEPYPTLLNAPYDATKDNTWHEISLQALTDGRVSLYLDGALLGVTENEVRTSDSLYVYIAGRSMYTANFVDDIEYQSSVLSVSRGNIDFGTVTVGDTLARRITCANGSLHSLRILDVDIGCEAFRLSQSDEDSLSRGVILESRKSCTFTVNYAPLDNGGFAIQSDTMRVITDRAPTPFLVNLTGTRRPIAFDWMSELLYTSRMIDASDQIAMIIGMGDSVEVDSVVVRYAPGGSTQYASNKLQLTKDDPKNDIFMGSLAASRGGSRGISFFTCAYNGVAGDSLPRMDEPIRFRVICSDMDFPERIEPREYHMIAIPLDLDSTVAAVLEDDLGERFLHTWRLYSYNPELEGYFEVQNSDHWLQGRAYWIIAKDGASLDIDGCQGISTPVDSAFELVLHPGWNQIGNPFAFPVAWDSILVNNMSMDAAEHEMLIYNRSPVSYDPADGYLYDIPLLEPFRGYWVWNTHSDSLILKIPPKEFAETLADIRPASKSHPEGFLASSNVEWMIEIRASCMGVFDRGSLCGISREAEDAWDSLDLAEPPLRPAEAMSIYFPHGEWNKNAGIYSVDLRKSHQKVNFAPLSKIGIEKDLWGHVWRFDVAKNFARELSGDKVELEFNGLEMLQANWCAYLLDLQSMTYMDLRRETRYEFFMGQREATANGELSRFALIMGSEEFADLQRDNMIESPTTTALQQNCPNPFNPSTLIPFDLAKESVVRLDIYDVKGAHIRNLINKRLSPQVCTVQWDGTDSRGRAVSSGIYFYRLVAEKTEYTRKMVLIR